MRKYVLATALLSLVFLANCGQIRTISSRNRGLNQSSAEYKVVGDKVVKFNPNHTIADGSATYRLEGDKIVKVDEVNFVSTQSEAPHALIAYVDRDIHPVKRQSQNAEEPFVTSAPMFKLKSPEKRKSPKVVNENKEPFVTSAPMFTPKKKVEPFVTSKPMFKVKPKEQRKHPKIMDITFDGTKKFWFSEVVPKFPDGYNVNRYKLAEEAKRQEIKPDMESYVGEDIGEGDIKISYDDIYFLDPAVPRKDISSDIIGIDSSIDKELTQVPDAGDLDIEYLTMLGDDVPNYEIVEDVSSVNGNVAERLFFGHGSARIAEDEKQKIQSISKNLSELDSEYRLSVVGHASERVDGVDDPKLKREINFKMAKQRADKVSGEFKKHGIEAQKILAVSKGDQAPNPNPPSGMTQEEADRRVDIFLDAKDYYY